MKTAIVTGASRGIGAAITRRLTEEGYRVFAIARSAESLAAIAEETSAIPVVADVGCIADCERIVNLATREGTLALLVNNAGCHRRGLFAELKSSEITEMIDVNLRAPIILTQLALPYLTKQPRAAVVQLASLAGVMPLSGSSTYSASKAGLRFFSLALAEELRGTHVASICVSPGPVLTDFVLDDLEHVNPITFSQPLSTPEQIADALVRALAARSPERFVPAMSGHLATLGYLWPWLSRTLRPWLQKKGERVKRALLTSRDYQTQSAQARASRKA